APPTRREAPHRPPHAVRSRPGPARSASRGRFARSPRAPRRVGSRRNRRRLPSKKELCPDSTAIPMRRRRAIRSALAPRASTWRRHRRTARATRTPSRRGEPFPTPRMPDRPARPRARGASPEAAGRQRGPRIRSPRGPARRRSLPRSRAARKARQAEGPPPPNESPGSARILPIFRCLPKGRRSTPRSSGRARTRAERRKRSGPERNPEARERNERRDRTPDPSSRRSSSPSHSRSMMRRALSRDCHGEKEKFGVSRRLSAELVAHPAHREDVLGPVGVAFDLLAEPIDEVVDRPGGAVVIESPHVPKDRLARKHFAPASDQELEELELLRRQLDALS